MRFHPIYGWGWFKGPGTLVVEVPTAFDVAVSSASEDVVEGTIEPPHRYAGMYVLLAVRTTSAGSKDWNVHISLPTSGMVSGFATTSVDLDASPGLDSQHAAVK